jgi:RNA polymerase sigma-70 factor (ECF subfamily)
VAPTDEELVSAARSGDRDAMNALLARHHDRIYAICRKVAGNDADAADASQEALIAIVRRLDRFDGRSTFSTWSYRVATNACLDELRRRKCRPEPNDPAQMPVQSHDEDVADRLGTEDEVQAALDQLPERYRAPVVLRDMADMEYADIGVTLGIPAGTVRSRIARGRAALADILGTKPPPHNVQVDDHD